MILTTVIAAAAFLGVVALFGFVCSLLRPVENPQFGFSKTEPNRHGSAASRNDRPASESAPLPEAGGDEAA